MDIAAFCRQSRVLIVAGKGGVGQDHHDRGAGPPGRPGRAVGAGGRARGAGRGGLGLRAQRPSGLRRLGAKAAGADPIGDTDGDSAPPIPPGTVRARTITPDDALLEYLADHGLRRVSKRLMSSGIVDLVAGSIPGIRDVLVLGKVKQLERSGIADLILVDAPATGHTMTFLSSAGGLLDAARSGPIRTQAADVVELLSDPARCQVALVTLPEEMPVNEAIEAAYQLEDKVGIALGPVIVNGCYPAMAGLDVPAGEAAAAAGVDPRPRAGLRPRAGPHGSGSPASSSRRTSSNGWPASCPCPSSGCRSCSPPSIGPSELDALSRCAGGRGRGTPRPDRCPLMTAGPGSRAAAGGGARRRHRRGGPRAARSSSAAVPAGSGRRPRPPPSPSRRPGSGAGPAW